jgi:hypothetical protein
MPLPPDVGHAKIYLDANLALKEDALKKTSPLNAPVGRFKSGIRHSSQRQPLPFRYHPDAGLSKGATAKIKHNVRSLCGSCVRRRGFSF